MGAAIPIPKTDVEPLASVLRMLQLEPKETDTFMGQSLPQLGGRVYGGQILGQSLLAAAATVADPEDWLPHSIQGYFLHGGSCEKPFELAVSRIHDGRSFARRSVAVMQEGTEILTMGVSFQRHQSGLAHQPAAPTAPAPETLPGAMDFFKAIDHPVAKYLGKTWAFDVHYVSENLYVQAPKVADCEQMLWMRPRAGVPAGLPQVVQRALLTYVIDQIMLEPVLRAHQLSWLSPGLALASLDHTMWYHADIDISDWLLYVQEAPFSGGARGLGMTKVYDRQGHHVATAVQEGMLRLPTEARTDGKKGRWEFDFGEE